MMIFFKLQGISVAVNKGFISCSIPIFLVISTRMSKDFSPKNSIPEGDLAAVVLV